MRSWKRKFQQTWQSLDIKPFGRWKKSIEGSVREEAKREVRRQVDDMVEGVEEDHGTADVGNRRGD